MLAILRSPLASCPHIITYIVSMIVCMGIVSLYIYICMAGYQNVGSRVRRYHLNFQWGPLHKYYDYDVGHFSKIQGKVHLVWQAQ